ncbi:MAG: S8 family serine peptidase [Ginsengibacter sp.]
MKKIILLITISCILIISAVVFTSFKKEQDNTLFYYGFKEKIYLETVPQKYVVRYKNKDVAKTGLANLQTKGISKAIDFKDDRTAVIDLLKADAASILPDLQKQPDVVSFQPLYNIIRDRFQIATTDEILIKFNSNATQASIDAILKKYNLLLFQKGQVFNTYIVSKGVSTLQVANAIQETDLVIFSHPNFYMPVILHQVPNDPYFGFQWNLHNTGQVINDGHTGTAGADIHAPEAWPISMGSSSVVVAVLDEGLTSNHSDLPNTRQVRLNGSNFSTAVPGNDPSAVGDGNHGNACSGIIAASRDNAEGIAGIAPNCKIMPVKILNPSGSNASIANAITFAKSNGAHILSNSWGYGSSDPNLVPAIVTAIQDAVTTGRGGLGCVVVFSAGNTADQAASNTGFVAFPGNVNIAGVITVGASDRYDHQSNYSPTSNTASPDNQVVDIVAPSHKAYPCQLAGETFEIWSMDIPGTAGYNSWHESDVCLNPPAVGSFLPSAGTNFQSYTGRMGGTSAACPEVAGAAALLLSINPGLTQQQVFNLLTQNADKVGGYSYNSSGFSNQLGFGRLNLYRSVLKAGPDLYVKDQTTDAGLEPNPDNVSPYYVSPDIWVRNANDGLTTHQNPEFGQLNYVYVKVTNRGTLASSGSLNKLKLYWAKASTGLSWPFPWTGASIDCSGGMRVIGGPVGTLTVSATSAGGSTTYVFPWNPPNPANYIPCFGTDASHFCLLARIETIATTPFGMAFPETNNLWSNVKNNNNIAWKNISIVNLLPDMMSVRTSVLLAGGKFLGKSFTRADLQFVVPAVKADVPLLKATTVDIDLGKFGKNWLEAGGKVEGGQIIKNDKGQVLVRITAERGTIYGIPISPTQVDAVTIVITPVKFIDGGVYAFDVQQMDGKTVVGGERFDIRFAKQKTGFAKSIAPPAIENTSLLPKLKAYQNGKQLIIQMNDSKEYEVAITNSIGQVITNLKMIRQASVPVDSYRAGIYYIKIINSKEGKAYSTGTLIK